MHKQRLKQEIGLKLSPQQIQFLGLLQIPLLSLEKRIEEELENNPALEEQAENDNAPEPNEQNWEKNSFRNTNKEDSVREFTHQRELSLQEFLLQQLPMLNLNEKEASISEFIIGCLDDNGFLSRSLLSITDDLLFKMNLEISEYELVPLLKNIQTLDPIGVGARDLQECLLIQLENKPATSSVTNAIEILTKEYSAFSNKNYEKLGRELNLNQEALKAAYKEIGSLNPKPG
ncbi:RNA polymerase sigma-54 factor, partial [bacterium]|nr:RNA polymerase sigma-54 factor [bacterium]